MDAAFHSLIAALEQCTGMSFREESNAGNLCFVNDPELQPDYRSSFSSRDTWNYIFKTTSFETKEQVDFSLVPLPKDAAAFWIAVGK